MSRGRSVPTLLVALAMLAVAACSPVASPVSAGSSATEPPSATSPSEGQSGPPGSVAPVPGALAKAACSMPHRELLRIWRGVEPDRSGDIIVVPREPNFLGYNFPHSGPWDYLQDVPLFWYGPRYVPAVGAVDRPVTIADIAPTQAGLLQFDFAPLDGKPLREIPAPAGGAKPPRLIVTLVWDAAGMSVLDAYPDDWPVLRSLIPKGVWYENATVGSSPSITPATHATIGTGDFPMRTGQVDAEFRLGSELVRAGALGPVLMMEPTLADLYDRAMGNRPLVGGLASVTWHLNMMGHGALWGGGDRDIAVLRTAAAGSNEGAEGATWNLQGKNEPFYTFPSYVNDLPPIASYTGELDREDGKLDGKWRDNSIAQYEEGWATPARVPYQTRMIEEVIGREGFGADDVPDLMFLNYKIIDHISHIWSVNSVEMQDTLRWQDAGLGELVRFLNRQVGRGEWVLVLTADHGAQFDPAVSGAFALSPRALELDLTEAFDDDDDVPLLQAVRVAQIFVNGVELRDNGFTLEEVAQFVLDYTKGQAASANNPVPETERDDTIFAAAFPTSMLGSLKCLPEARA
ncbi:MAG: alkaline phosphatase family protein [Actinobacteria bacterium]|nr:alkaline phosphatase family protein [Actinomycetota bacterium]